MLGPWYLYQIWFSFYFFGIVKLFTVPMLMHLNNFGVIKVDFGKLSCDTNFIKNNSR